MTPSGGCGHRPPTAALPTTKVSVYLRRMSRLKIVVVDERDAGAVYLVDRAGQAWRVYDCVGERAGRRDSVMPPDGIATHRIFVSRDGVRRAYRFGCKDSRALVPRLVAGQLAAAVRVRSGA